MTTTPDPQIVRGFARRAILSSAGDVDYIGIGEQFSDDEAWPTEEGADDAMLAAVDAERQKATVTVSWPDEQPQDAIPLAAAELAELTASVEHLSGPDAWDEDRLEPALIPVMRYMRRVLAAQVKEQPRTERAAVHEGHGPGVPGAMHLEAFGQSIADAFGDCPYHVGSSATSKTWRDVDVRLILDDERFHALFPGFKAANHIDAWWSLLCAALSELGRARTGLPIDFQIQAQTEANEKYSGIRNPLFLIHAKDDHRPAMTAPQQPERDTAPTSCLCGCGRPDDDTGMCHCPEPCPCEPGCGFCLVPNPMREPERDTANGGAE